MQLQPLPGFRDFFPEEFALRAHILRTWRQVAERYGFEEYDGPPLESLELYTAKSGAEIVGQLYSFRDKGDRDVALRPEMTPTLARMVAARANGLRKPIRWFSTPQLFRYERQQRGRLREHFQLNCDLIGEAGPLADAEIIALAIDVLRGFGLGPGDVRVRLSDRRVLRALLTAGGVREEQLPDAYQAIDKIERMDQVALASQLSGSGLAGGAIERVFAIARLRGWDAVRGALDESAEGTEAAAPLARTIAALDAMGLGAFIDVDLTIVRGLAYYTGTVFEIFDARGEMRAICGGGRYDDLLAALGGVELPALGFGMGDVVLGDLLRARGLAPSERSTIDVFVAAVTPEDLTEALSVAHALRDAGFRAEYALGTQRLDKQLKLADARDARFAIVVGPDERKRGEVVLRNLDDKAQSSVALDEVVAALAAAMRGGNGRIQDAAGSRGTNG